ncbi:MAG: hypothetical protein HY081_04785 [Gammaproteobacteria bacterium]|nr:hypothetical protein [Gammaproteobacteria bacterium]
MHVAGLIGLLFFLLAGCAGMGGVSSEGNSSPSKAAAVEPSNTNSTSTNVAKTEAPNTKAPAKPATPAPAKKANPTPNTAKPATPSLDLTSLETRLKETKAIGVFTKITLKNQVDDLLNQFRAHYQGQTKTNLTELRQPYDRLLLKVLSLLQDGDPELARAIVASREEIWGILSDPKKFATLST